MFQVDIRTNLNRRIYSFSFHFCLEQKEMFLFVLFSSWNKYKSSFVPIFSLEWIETFLFRSNFSWSEKKRFFSFQFLPGAKGFVPIQYQNQSEKTNRLCIRFDIVDIASWDGPDKTEILVLTLRDFSRGQQLNVKIIVSDPYYKDCLTRLRLAVGGMDV